MRSGIGVRRIRLTSGLTTDATDAAALTHAYSTNDVYNNSWGPSDNGNTLAAPGPLTQAAYEDAVANGRGGLGTVYVWAAGNGLENDDNVNYDGWGNSRFTIAVGATDFAGVQSWYSEPGAAMLVNAGSSGDTVGITTTDRSGAPGYSGTDCTDTFGGTSSSSPLVAGVVALMLEANPSLTGRDVQHVLVETAEQNDPGDADWATNGAGHLVNHKYGFGRVDAHAATAAAAGWSTLAEAVSVSTGTMNVGQAIPDNTPSGTSDSVTITEDITLEHVEVVFDATHTYRGDLEVVLTSPDGTESVLAEPHVTGGGADYPNWKFMSVRHWGESSAGTWTLTVSDHFAEDTGTFASWELILHGTGDVTPNRPPTVSGASWSVPENSAAGTSLGTVLASDPDGDSLTYSITAGNTAGAFAINSATGKVTVAGPLDFETKSIYTLTVSASDGSLSDAGTAHVDVTDVAEFVVPSSATFGDVPLSHVFFADVEWMAWSAVTKGCNPPGNDLFCPDGFVTRGQMAAFLHRALGDVLVPSTPVSFVDDDGSVFEEDIEWLGATGVTKGCNPPTNDRFCPDGLVTRGQMAAFLVRALGLTDDGGGDLFLDDDGSTFESDIDKLGASGITQGCNPPANDRFCPAGFVTRGQMAAFLHRALGDM